MEEPGPRIDRLTESIPILLSAFGGRVEFKGHHFDVKGDIPHGRPGEWGQPRLLIGAGGPRMLRLAARYADTVAFNPTAGDRDVGAIIAGLTTESVKAKSNLLSKAAGERFEQIEIARLVMGIDMTGSETQSAHSWGERTGLPIESQRESQSFIIGSQDEICEQLMVERRLTNTSYIVIPYVDLEAFAPVVRQLTGR
jgi:alkanesulfonate monooxygenase SsuD/methylene tetrahydromethanopterin reductase-like flavin-dependent oxidoreductase (luciferase family)